MNCEDIKVLHLACKKERDEAVALLQQFLSFQKSIHKTPPDDFIDLGGPEAFEDFERKVNKFIKSLEAR